MEYEVSLDILSGLPNPAWRLSVTDADRLRQWLGTLPPKEPLLSSEPPLGYRGIAVRRVADPTGVFQIHVFDESVVANGNTLSDSGRKLEEWLLRSGKPQVSESLWKAALAAINETRV